MNELFDLRPTNKEVAFGILFVFAFLVVSFCIGYMLGVERTNDNLPNHGSGIDHVGEQLGAAVGNQHEITAGIQDTVNTGGAIAGTSSAIAGTAEAIAGSVNEAGRIIDECQQILGRVRNRGKAGAVKD